MSEVIDSFPKERGRPAEYDWARWMNGKAHVLIQEEDFPNAKIPSFRTHLHRMARSRGMYVRTKKGRSKDGREALIIMFSKRKVN